MKTKRQLQKDLRNLEAEHRVYLLTKVKGPDQQAGAALLVRALDRAGKTIATADTAFLDAFLNGKYTDDTGLILPTKQKHLNGVKAFFKNSITAITPEFLEALEKTEPRVGKTEEQLQDDLRDNNLDEAEHRAYLLTQRKQTSEKAGAALLVRALDSAGKTIATADTAFLDAFLDGKYTDDTGLIQPTTQKHLNGVKAFFKNSITAITPEFLEALEKTELRVGKTEEQLQDDLRDNILDEAEHRAYLLTQRKQTSEKAGAALLIRALDAAEKTIATADTAFLDAFLNGKYTDDTGLIQPSKQKHLAGVKAFFKNSITAITPEFLEALEKTELRVGKTEEQLQDDLRDNILDEAEHRAYILTRIKGTYQQAGAALLVRALDRAGKTIATADTAFLDAFLDGKYTDDTGLIQPSKQKHLAGAKAFFKNSISYRDQSRNIITAASPAFLTTMQDAEPRVGKTKEQLQDDLRDNILDEAEHRAYLLTRVKSPSEQAGAALLARALDRAGKTIATADTAFLDAFLDGKHTDKEGQIKPTKRTHLNGVKIFFKNSITAITPEFLEALEKTEPRVGKTKEQLQDDLRNNILDEAEHRTYLLTRVKSPSEQAGAALLVRALDRAGKTIATADTAFLNTFLDGKHIDKKGQIKPTKRTHLNGVKTFFNNSITAITPEFLEALEKAKPRVGKTKEQLQDDLRDNILDEAEHRAYLLTQVNGTGQKAGAALLVRALDAAEKTIATADTVFLKAFLNGDYIDDTRKVIQPTTPAHLNGVKTFFNNSITVLTPEFLRAVEELPTSRKRKAENAGELPTNRKRRAFGGSLLHPEGSPDLSGTLHNSWNPPRNYWNMTGSGSSTTLIQAYGSNNLSDFPVDPFLLYVDAQTSHRESRL